jgi:hypothetical protein
MDFFMKKVDNSISFSRQEQKLDDQLCDGLQGNMSCHTILCALVHSVPKIVRDCSPNSPHKILHFSEAKYRFSIRNDREISDIQLTDVFIVVKIEMLIICSLS